MRSTSCQIPAGPVAIADAGFEMRTTIRFGLSNRISGVTSIVNGRLESSLSMAFLPLIHTVEWPVTAENLRRTLRVRQAAGNSTDFQYHAPMRWGGAPPDCVRVGTVICPA